MKKQNQRNLGLEGFGMLVWSEAYRRRNQSQLCKGILITTKYICFIVVGLSMLVEWLFSRLNLTYIYKYMDVFLHWCYIFLCNDCMVNPFPCGNCQMELVLEMSDFSISFWLMLLIILMIESLRGLWQKNCLKRIKLWWKRIWSRNYTR